MHPHDTVLYFMPLIRKVRIYPVYQFVHILPPAHSLIISLHFTFFNWYGKEPGILEKINAACIIM